MRSSSIIFTVLCVIGFSYHFQDMASVYFAFRTNSRIDLPLDYVSDKPAVVFCSRYTELLDRSHYRKYKISKEASNNKSIYQKDMEALTMEQIFELTPHEKDILVGCQWRENDHDLTTYGETKCRGLFNVTKYVDGRFVCYQFAPNDYRMERNCYKLSKSFYSESEIYVVILNRTVSDRAHFVRIIDFIPFQDDDDDDPVINLPHISRRFSYLGFRFNNYDAKISDNNYFVVMNDAYSIERMKSPYDKGCTDDIRKYRSTCSRACNIQAYKKQGLVPGNEFILDQKINLRHFSFKDINNKSLLEILGNSTNECDKHCTQDLCKESYSVTTVRIMPYTLKNTINIAAGCPARPLVRIKFIPRMNTYEFILFTCSCFGIWFGVSIISLNPFDSRLESFLKKMIGKKSIVPLPGHRH